MEEELMSQINTLREAYRRCLAEKEQVDMSGPPDFRESKWLSELGLIHSETKSH